MEKLKNEIFIKLFLLLLITFFVISCKDDITSPPEKPIYTSEIKGKVILENQTEHSNALVYLDSLNRGVGTDSSGFYSIVFTDEDSIYNGVFKLYFFVNEYEMDSAYYVLEKGKVKLDSLDVDSEGKLPTKELKQLLLIEGWTERQEYRTGDTLRFTAKFTNVTNRIINVFIYSVFADLGWVSLYNENYHAFNLSPCLISDLDLNIFLQPNDFYEGFVIYTIPDSNYCIINVAPLLPNEYIVVADLFVESRLRIPLDKFERFIREDWYKIHRGKTPKLDWFPNKYKYPTIKINE